MMTLLLLSACTEPPGGWGYGTENGVNTDFNSPPPEDAGDTGDIKDTGKAGDTGDTGDTEDNDVGTLPEDGTGYGVGDTAYNLQGTDHTGRPWALYDQLGSPIGLLVGHRPLGTTMTEPMGFVGAVGGGAASAALIGRSEISAAATVDDAARYAAKYGISSVLYDPTYASVDLWSEASTAKAYVIDRALVIQWVGYGGSITQDALSGALEGL